MRSTPSKVETGGEAPGLAACNSRRSPLSHHCQHHPEALLACTTMPTRDGHNTMTAPPCLISNGRDLHPINRYTMRRFDQSGPPPFEFKLWLQDPLCPVGTTALMDSSTWISCPLKGCLCREHLSQNVSNFSREFQDIGKTISRYSHNSGMLCLNA